MQSNLINKTKKWNVMHLGYGSLTKLETCNLLITVHTIMEISDDQQILQSTKAMICSGILTTLTLAVFYNSTWWATKCLDDNRQRFQHIKFYLLYYIKYWYKIYSMKTTQQQNNII